MIFTSKSRPLDIINFLRENYDITVNIINKNTKSILEGTLEHTKELIIDDSVKILDIRNFFSKKCTPNLVSFFGSTYNILYRHTYLVCGYVGLEFVVKRSRSILRASLQIDVPNPTSFWRSITNVDTFFMKARGRRTRSSLTIY